MVVVTDPTDGQETRTLPGGGVDPLEDPVDTVIREVAEETGRTAQVVRLLGVDSRVIPAHDAVRGVPHQNIGIFYEVSLTDSDRDLRAEASGDTRKPSWIPLDQVTSLRRSGLVDVGRRLLETRPATGHFPDPPCPGDNPLIRH